MKTIILALCLMAPVFLGGCSPADIAILAVKEVAHAWARDLAPVECSKKVREARKKDPKAYPEYDPCV